MYKTIVMHVDGSVHQDATLRAASLLAKELVVPGSWSGQTLTGTAVVGWDGSMPAYLARHGVAVDVVVEHAPDGAGEALLARAESEEASLLVAGAFGHSRYREWVLGGVTRDLLQRARVPVLFSH